MNVNKFAIEHDPADNKIAIQKLLESIKFDAHQNNILQNLLHADYHVTMFEGTRISHETIALRSTKNVVITRATNTLINESK